MGKKAAATPRKDRLVVGISGASGVIYGIRLLEALKELGIESHLVVSKAAQLTLELETNFTLKAVLAKADRHYAAGDVGAAIASGSFPVQGMVVAPCSIKTMGEIATGATASLIARSADVAMKERRRVVLMLRETPLHLGHIRSMAAVTEAGAIVYPPVPALYARPKSLDDVIDYTLGRVLDLFDIDLGLAGRWTGARTRPERAT